MALTDAEKRAWTQKLDEIAETIEKWRQDRDYVEQLIFRREYKPVGTVLPINKAFEYPFEMCDMERLKKECYATIDAMIAMKEQELQEQTDKFNELLRK